MVSLYLALIRVALRGLYGKLLYISSRVCSFFQLRPPFFRSPVAITLASSDCEILTQVSLVYADYGGAIVNHQNEFLVHLSRYPWGNCLHPVRSSLFFLKKKKKCNNGIYLLTPEASGNFYHWMMDCVPRIQIAREFSKAYFLRSDLILHSTPALYEMQSLLLSGLGSHSILRLSSSESLECQNLLIPPLLGDSALDTKTKIDCLRRFFRHPEAVDSGDNSKVSPFIYITRRRAFKRRLHNEFLLLSHLMPLGFQCLCLEELPLQLQISAFSRASVVVSSHGAGLVLSAFMKEGAALIEIVNRQCIKFFFENMATCNRLKYRRILADPVSDLFIGKSLTSDPIHGNSCDLVVSEELLRSLDQAICGLNVLS